MRVMSVPHGSSLIALLRKYSKCPHFNVTKRHCNTSARAFYSLVDILYLSILVCSLFAMLFHICLSNYLNFYFCWLSIIYMHFLFKKQDLINVGN